MPTRFRGKGRCTIVAMVVLAVLSSVLPVGANDVGIDPADGGVDTEAVAADAGGEVTPPRPNVTRSTCAGVRGNGQNLFAHYGALARHVEEYGAITCVAGGSSGSITAFLMESMWANPDLHNCDGSACRNRLRDDRYALMLKSVIGVVESGLFEDVVTVQALVDGVSSQNILELLQSDVPAEGIEALERLLRDLGPLINTEVFELLANSPDPVFHATDIIEGLQKGLQFQVDDPAVFLRTPVINFDEVASLFGLYGSFYAGYGPVDRPGMQDWLDSCARQSRGATWEELRDLPGTKGRTCGDMFGDLFNEYRERFATHDGPSRVDDPVGLYMPAFGVTGVLTGDAITLWQEARDAWLRAEPIAYEPDFDDIGVGYWGNDIELFYMALRLYFGRDDLVSQQFRGLGSASWREVLSSSPAEPGFAPAIPLSSGVMSVGGWADPLRVIPLDTIARRTIAINRLGGVGGFTESVTRLLNADDADVAALYSTTDPASSFFIGLDEATGVWCTDWDGQEGDPNRLFNDAYTSPLITDDRRLLRPRYGYQNVGPDFAIGGCTPGIDVVADGIGVPGPR